MNLARHAWRLSRRSQRLRLSARWPNAALETEPMGMWPTEIRCPTTTRSVRDWQEAATAPWRSDGVGWAHPSVPPSDRPRWRERDVIRPGAEVTDRHLALRDACELSDPGGSTLPAGSGRSQRIAAALRDEAAGGTAMAFGRRTAGAGARDLHPVPHPGQPPRRNS